MPLPLPLHCPHCHAGSSAIPSHAPPYRCVRHASRAMWGVWYKPSRRVPPPRPAHTTRIRCSRRRCCHGGGGVTATRAGAGAGAAAAFVIAPLPRLSGGGGQVNATRRRVCAACVRLLGGTQAAIDLHARGCIGVTGGIGARREWARSLVPMSQCTRRRRGRGRPSWRRCGAPMRVRLT